MKIEEIRLGKSAVTDNVYAGKPSNDGMSWSSKKDVTNDFLKCVIERWAGYVETITDPSGRVYEVSVKEIKK